MPTLEIISLLLNLLLGTGLIIQFLTIRAIKKEADAKADLAKAQADEKEIENVDKAIRIWREIAESIGKRNADLIVQNEQLIKLQDEMSAKLEKLDKQVSRLNTINGKIVKLLDQITPDNLEAKINEIKNQVHNEA